MDNLYQEGGLADDGTQVEPVTGNEVPPGSMAEEVRDDVDAKLSEGEYVLPADVVRFIGLGQIERMVAKAKKGLEEMDANGRIGGEPVDSEGVPMEDDELTPEEMQMLAEALGQAPTGMAMGGMVTPDPYQQQQMQYTQPVGMAEGGLTPAAPFNPSQYQFGGPSGSMGSSGGIQVVEYINTDTGETRLVSILNGKPMGVVPPGFVPSTPEAVAQAQKNSQKVETKTEGTTDVLSPGNDSESDQRRAEMAEGRDETSWAEDNYAAIAEDPIGYGLGKLEGAGEKSMIDRLAPAGALFGGAGLLAGAAISTASKLNPLAEARAAMGFAKEKGMDTTDLEAKIKEYEEALKGPAKLMENLGAAQGDNYLKRLLEYTPLTTSAKTKDVSEDSLERIAEIVKETGGGETDFAGGKVEVREDPTTGGTVTTYTPDNEENDDDKDAYGVSVRSGSAAPSQPTTRPQGRPMAKGGFVSKPSNYKSKVTRKKENKRRGLGSK